MQTVDSKFYGAVVVEINEITNAESASYKIVLEEKNKKYKLRVNNLGQITEVQSGKLKK